MVRWLRDPLCVCNHSLQQGLRARWRRAGGLRELGAVLDQHTTCSPRFTHGLKGLLLTLAGNSLFPGVRLCLRPSFLVGRASVVWPPFRVNPSVRGAARLSCPRRVQLL